MKQKTMTPLIITKDEKYINDPVSIGNTFNDFFYLLLRMFTHSKIQFSNKSFRNFLLSEINYSFITISTNKEKTKQNNIVSQYQ